MPNKIRVTELTVARILFIEDIPKVKAPILKNAANICHSCFIREDIFSVPFRCLYLFYRIVER